MRAYIDNLHWWSDWNGEDVGYPDVPVVGLYTNELGVDFYIDMETHRVLEIMVNCEEDW